MKILIIGGPKNGEWIETADGAKVWLDLVHASTHAIRRITWTINALDGTPVEAYVLHLAVHPELAGHPQEQVLTIQMLNMISMAEYARTHGEPQEIPKEPSASKRADGAVILGADGKPA